jgi:predicted acylesterase/phospholipase RssA
MATTHVILADVGGGTRGQFTARLARRIADRCGFPLSELFTLRSGTSAGALNVGGTALPGPDGKPRYSEAYIDEHWADFCQRIFATNKLRQTGQYLGLGAQYPDKGIEGVLKDLAGDTLMGELIGRVMIPAYDTYGQHDAQGNLIAGTLGPVFFKSWNPQDAQQLARNVMRASSAAPTYFNPTQFGNYGCLIDGGLAANSPGTDALAEAINLSNPGDDFVVVTLGTGRYQYGYTYRQLRWMSKLMMIGPVLDFYSDGQRQVTNYQLDKILDKQIASQFKSRRTPDFSRYFAFDANLTASQNSIDNKSPANLKSLQDLADRTVDVDMKDKFEALCRQLVALRHERVSGVVE